MKKPHLSIPKTVPCVVCKGTGQVLASPYWNVAVFREVFQVFEEESMKVGALIGDVTGPSRAKKLVWARHQIMYRLQYEFEMPLKVIGYLLGDRDTTTVIHGLNKVKATMGGRV